ncbi:hypothetical protein KGM_213251 [Danaus plexippus plexippus]|uniref:GDPGP1-like N-terminal domain-containing protein n=1 Tax=Danaus plexippus plexippus TaxID=278856 RepID=A0A212FL46_DANPL|nr:hypothetical protein KGM_213251 [Danaus plexippus plexippus]
MGLNPSEVINLIKTKWDEIHSNTNVFRYKIANEEKRFVNNKYYLQLNPNRGVKRRTPEQMENISQPFDKNKFNFCKVSKDEVMFHFKQDKGMILKLLSLFMNKIYSYHTVLINASPINKYHSLLCPFLEDCLPQIITKDSLMLAVKFMLMAENRDLRLGYNSLLAMASVNHLHFHIFIVENDLPVETVVSKCIPVKGPLYRFENTYPIPTFCFEIGSVGTKIDDVYKLLEYFLHKNIAHNMFLTRGNSVASNNEVLRILIWPRTSCLHIKQFDAFNIACCELSGWLPVYSKLKLCLLYFGIKIFIFFF